MIQITYHEKYNAVTIEGHALSGEPGRDLICSAVSTLAYTLAANVANLEDAGQVRDMTTDLQPGHADIRCTPLNRTRSVVGLVFQTVILGFQILARDYPEYVQIETLV